MPVPPDFGKDAFSQLLRQLEDQHKKDVVALLETITDLRSRLADEPQGPELPRVEVEAPRVENPMGSGVLCQARTVEGGEGGGSVAIEVELLDPGDNAADGLISEGGAEAGGLADPGATEVAGVRPLVRPTSDASLATHPSRRNSSNKLARLAEKGDTKHNYVMDGVIGACILANIVFIFLGLEYDGYQIAVNLGLQPPGKWPDLDFFLEAAQYVFCTIFLIELGVRLAVFRLRYFYNGRCEIFNIVDAIIVIISVCDLYFIRPLTAQQSNISVFRALRFFRLARALRVVRTFEVFTKLRVLMGTIVASFLALVWSMVLLFITMLMFGLIMCQLVHPHLEEPTMSDNTVRWLFQHYGTAGRSLWTVFELTFSGGWPNYARPLVEEVSPVFAYVFAGYISIVVFAMTRIITALFLKDTLQVAANDAEMMIQEKMNEKKAYAKKLMNVFEAADITGDGRISLEEFEVFLQDPKVKSYLSTLELDTHETKTLFAMLDDGDGEVTAEEFVEGAMRLKGTARSQDVISIMHDFNSLRKTVEHMAEHLLENHSKAED